MQGRFITDNEYQTADLFEITFLFYMRYPYRIIEGAMGKKLFIFSGDQDAIRDDVYKFWCNEAYPAQGMLSAQSDIKKMLLSGEYQKGYFKKIDSAQ